MWEKQINRQNFKISPSTVVCSNHFVSGYYNNSCNVPTLFMKDYTTDDSKKRKLPIQRDNVVKKKLKRLCSITRHGFDDIPPQVEEDTPPPSVDHDYNVLPANESCARCFPKEFCKSCSEKSKTIQTLLQKIKVQQEEIDKLKENLERKPFSIHDIKHSNKLVTLYTGLQSFAVFKWLFDRLSHKVKSLTYTSYKQESSGKNGAQNVSFQVKRNCS